MSSPEIQQPLNISNTEKPDELKKDHIAETERQNNQENTPANVVGKENNKFKRRNNPNGQTKRQVNVANHRAHGQRINHPQVRGPFDGQRRNPANVVNKPNRRRNNRSKRNDKVIDQRKSHVESGGDGERNNQLMAVDKSEQGKDHVKEPDVQGKYHNRDAEKPQRRNTFSFNNKKGKFDAADGRNARFGRKRSHSYPNPNGKYFPPFKRRKKDGHMIPPTKFLLGGNIYDPLNLNSLQDEETNRVMNAVTPKSSPVPTPKHRRGKVEVIIPPNLNDPLNLTCDDDSKYEEELIPPAKRNRKTRHRKRKRHSSGSGGNNSKDTSLEKPATTTSADIIDEKSKKDQLGEDSSTPAVASVDANLTDFSLQSKNDDKNISSSTGDFKPPQIETKTEDVMKLKPLEKSFEGKNLMTLESIEETKDIKERGTDSSESSHEQKDIIKEELNQPQNDEDKIGVIKRDVSQSPQRDIAKEDTNDVSQKDIDTKPVTKRSPEEKRDLKRKYFESPQKDRREPNRKMRKIDKIVSPVIPQPGSWKRTLPSGDGRFNRFRNRRINVPEATPKFKEKDAKYQYGNYNRYYGYRNPHQIEDPRLKIFSENRDLFVDKQILDIGCNVGHVTLTVARDFGAKTVTGMDIDRNLITIARKNIKHYIKQTDSQENEVSQFRFPASMSVLYGPMDPPGQSPSPHKGFPHNVTFVSGDYVLASDALLEVEKPQFDVILCLSLTKWLHLNYGDAGLKRAFKRMYLQLFPGGKLILEAQSFNSYNRKKKLTERIYNNYKTLELLPQKFNQYLLSPEVGFIKCEVLGTPFNQSKGFRRPIRVFTKSDDPIDGFTLRKPVYTAVSCSAEDYDDDEKSEAAELMETNYSADVTVSDNFFAMPGVYSEASMPEDLEDSVFDENYEGNLELHADYEGSVSNITHEPDTVTSETKPEPDHSVSEVNLQQPNCVSEIKRSPEINSEPFKIQPEFSVNFSQHSAPNLDNMAFINDNSSVMPSSMVSNDDNFHIRDKNTSVAPEGDNLTVPDSLAIPSESDHASILEMIDTVSENDLPAPESSVIVCESDPSPIHEPLAVVSESDNLKVPCSESSVTLFESIQEQSVETECNLSSNTSESHIFSNPVPVVKSSDSCIEKTVPLATDAENQLSCTKKLESNETSVSNDELPSDEKPNEEKQVTDAYTIRSPEENHNPQQSEYSIAAYTLRSPEENHNPQQSEYSIASPDEYSIASPDEHCGSNHSSDELFSDFSSDSNHSVQPVADSNPTDDISIADFQRRLIPISETYMHTGVRHHPLSGHDNDVDDVDDDDEEVNQNLSSSSSSSSSSSPSPPRPPRPQLMNGCVSHLSSSSSSSDSNGSASPPSEIDLNDHIDDHNSNGSSSSSSGSSSSSDSSDIYLGLPNGYANGSHEE